MLMVPLAACATGPLPPSARLPADVTPIAADPMRSAILTTAFTFNHQSLPADRARAAALMEYLAADYRWDVRWAEYTPITASALEASRRELHAAFGVAPGATPQAVVDGFVGASRAFEAQATPVLSPAVFTQPTLTLARLSGPIDLPATRNASALMERELLRIDTERMNGIGGGSGGGGSGGGGGAHP
ncbi:hypothetical protein [Roseococcus pinisoli]|uniref:Uncharacterized protein n=1 Tax=Roseococcus pinisoli TaxID=2835040 RepID=A0ABS5QEG4_9PROT|nr:hypothetical protein [Roseococcus pinisoli]MBS7811937.1 hypothetical protein [Roseococcus pinisoli]